MILSHCSGLNTNIYHIIYIHVVLSWKQILPTLSETRISSSTTRLGQNPPLSSLAVLTSPLGWLGYAPKEACCIKAFCKAVPAVVWDCWTAPQVNFFLGKAPIDPRMGDFLGNFHYDGEAEIPLVRQFNTSFSKMMPNYNTYFTNLDFPEIAGGPFPETKKLPFGGDSGHHCLTLRNDQQKYGKARSWKIRLPKSIDECHDLPLVLASETIWGLSSFSQNHPKSWFCGNRPFWRQD